MPLLCTLFGLNWVKEAQGTRTSLEKKYTQQCYGHGWTQFNDTESMVDFKAPVRPTRIKPWTTRTKNPAWSGVVRVNPRQILDASLGTDLVISIGQRWEDVRPTIVTRTPWMCSLITVNMLYNITINSHVYYKLATLLCTTGWY